MPNVRSELVPHGRRFASLAPSDATLDRAWFERELVALGCASVVTEDQRIAGYTNARFRFSVLATRA